MTIHDFDGCCLAFSAPTSGTGKLGKSAGMILAEHILRKKAQFDPAVGTIRIPESWFITSDGVMDFIHYNYLEDFQSFKFRLIEEDPS